MSGTGQHRRTVQRFTARAAANETTRATPISLEPALCSPTARASALFARRLIRELPEDAEQAAGASSGFLREGQT